LNHITYTIFKKWFLEILYLPLRYQNKKVDEQFTHVYERQLQLETEVRSLIDALELEQAIRGSASHGISSSPCCKYFQHMGSMIYFCETARISRYQ